LIQEINFMGEDAPTGWEVGVFTPDDILAGGEVWVEGAQLGLAAWGDDAQTEDVVEGFVADQPFSFLVWDDEADVEYTATPNFTHGPETWQANGVSVLTLNASRELVVPLEEGWNLISINVTPPDEYWEGDRGPDIILMTEQFQVNQDSTRLIIIKDAMGRFYLPAWGFNNIPYWDLTQGYQVKMDVDYEAVWSGAPIPADTDISIEEGWNSIAYFPTYELDAGDPDFYVLSPIIDNVIVAKDGYGRFMLPEFDFSNMEPWRETQGYMIKTDDDVVLNYPPEQEEGIAVALISQEKETPNHWTTPISTGENMSMLVTTVTGVDFKEGDLIAAFSYDNRLVGVGTVNVAGRCGLAVWGDDPTTEMKDGLVKDEAFIMRLWNADNEIEVTLSAGNVHAGNGLIHETDGLVVLDLKAETILPEQFYLSHSYPNPFNAITKLSYGLPEPSQLLICVYDVAGRSVSTLVDGYQPAGHHAVVWDATETSSGVYFVVMNADDLKFVRKVMLMR